MNLSEEYIELMTRLLSEGQKHGLVTNQFDALVNAARYGPEIKQSEIDLIKSTAQKVLEEKTIDEDPK